jgi:hypothetical protein
MSRVSRTFKFTGKLIKFLFSLLIVFICVFLLWRVFGSGDPDSMKTLSVNDAVYEAYNEANGDLEIFNQGHLTITTAKDNRGYFSLTKTAIIPEANQIQVVLRYNNATIRHLEEDFSLESTPNRSDDLFDVSLFFSVDLTPENEEDNAIVSEAGTRTFRCSSVQVESDEKGLYNYRKFVFDLDGCGEDLSELIDSGTLLAVYADVYYVRAMDLDAKAYGTLFLYDYKASNIDIELSKEDIKNIEAYKSGR